MNMPDINVEKSEITVDTLLSYWKEQLPPLADYAELIGAPAWVYGCKMVYEDEYGYMVEATIKALENYKNYLDTVDKIKETDKYLSKLSRGQRATMNMYDDICDIKEESWDSKNM